MSAPDTEAVWRAGEVAALREALDLSQGVTNALREENARLKARLEPAPHSLAAVYKHEADRLRAQVAGENDSFAAENRRVWGKIADDALAEGKQLRAHVAALVKALEDYGQHQLPCIGVSVCHCGFDKALHAPDLAALVREAQAFHMLEEEVRHNMKVGGSISDAIDRALEALDAARAGTP